MMEEISSINIDKKSLERFYIYEFSVLCIFWYIFNNHNFINYSKITIFILLGTLLWIYLQEMHMFMFSKIIGVLLLLMSMQEAYINWDPFSNLDSSLFYYSVYSLFTIYLIYISFNPFK